MLLNEWLTMWLDLYKTGIRENTHQMYVVAIRVISRRAPSVDLATAGAEEWLALRAWLLEQHRETPRAAQLQQTTLVQALRKAQAVGIVPRGTDFGEVLPPLPHRAAETAVLDDAQLANYIMAARIVGGAEAVPLCLCCCGLRRGEAMGVRWCDWAAPVLTVRGQWQRGQWQPPKSRAGIRSLILPDWLAEMVEELPREGERISPVSVSQMRRGHERVMRFADLEGSGVTIHGLRHSFATLAAGSGVSMMLLKSCLGHAKVSLTADLYAGHRLPASILPSAVLGRVV